MDEDLINDNEYYPRNNSLEDLTNICKWATDAGMYIVVDVHGLPGAQKAQDAFTGRVRQFSRNKDPSNMLILSV